MSFSFRRFICNIETEYIKEEKPFDSGAFGEVYKGERKSDHLKVAIKVLSNKILQKTDDLETDFHTNQKCLIRELNILSSLDHPFCLNLINFNLSPQPIIITPFMPNGNIYNLIQNNDPKLSTQKNDSLYAICSTMDFLHKVGIIHRDFKPQNILINENNDICIADFGMSRKVDENANLTLAQIGSPLYMAPELILCDNYTNSVDVYSFGVLYYQFFSKKVKLDDNRKFPPNPRAFLNRIARGVRLIRPSNMSDDQWKVYTDCTNQIPSERPTFEELVNRFETNEDIWLDGVDKNEFMRYVAKCKKINEDTIEKHKDIYMQFNNEFISTPPISPILSRTAKLRKSQMKTTEKHFTYE